MKLIFILFLTTLTVSKLSAQKTPDDCLKIDSSLIRQNDARLFSEEKVYFPSVIKIGNHLLLPGENSDAGWKMRFRALPHSQSNYSPDHINHLERISSFVPGQGYYDYITKNPWMLDKSRFANDTFWTTLLRDAFLSASHR